MVFSTAAVLGRCPAQLARTSRPCSSSSSSKLRVAPPRKIGGRATLVCKASNSNSKTIPKIDVTKSIDDMGDFEAVTGFPVVHINNLADPLATIVDIKFDDVLGELLDTVAALENLGLNIKKVKVKGQDQVNRLYITDKAKSEKVTSSEKLEQIRFCVIRNLIDYHPESHPSLDAWRAPQIKHLSTELLGAKPEPAVESKVKCYANPDKPFMTELRIQTLDKPGLLPDITSMLKYMDLNVVSASLGTRGKEMRGSFLLSYKGGALPKDMQTMVQNVIIFRLTTGPQEESY